MKDSGCELKLELTFTEPMLGTKPGDKDIFSRHILDKAKEKGVKLTEEQKKDELESLPNTEEEIERQSTVYHKDEKGNPFLYDYQIKGFFKDACAMQNRVPDSVSSKIKAHKKVIDGLVFVFPRRIPIILPTPGEELKILERPLRGQTAQGERIALARSEVVPAGSKICVTIKLLDARLETPLEEWLEYGELRGIGQWRNASYGRFTYELKK